MLLPASRRCRQPGWFSPGGGGLVPDGLAAGGRDAGRRVAGRQGPDVGVEHLEDLHLHGGERRQSPAQAGAKQRPPVAGQRQAFGEAGNEVAEQERGPDI